MDIKVDNEAIEKLVQEKIRLAVAETLQKNSAVLVDRLVDEALNKEDRNSYGRKTVVQVLIEGMIRGAAKEATQDWLDEQKPKIRKLVHQRLSRKTDGIVTSVVDQLVGGLKGSIDVAVWFKRDD